MIRMDLNFAYFSWSKLHFTQFLFHDLSTDYSFLPKLKNLKKYFCKWRGSFFWNTMWQKGESQNGGNKNTNHAKFSEKRTFFTPWYAPCIRTDYALLPTIFEEKRLTQLLSAMLFIILSKFVIITFIFSTKLKGSTPVTFGYCLCVAKGPPLAPTVDTGCN